MWFLLCALVQVASLVRSKRLQVDSPSALRTCASCFHDRETGELSELGLLLCALVQVASSLRFKRENVSTGFCSAHLCKLLLTYPMMICRFEVFCSAHLCKLLRHGAAAPDLPAVLLLCALVQVASAKLHSSLRQAVEAICIGAQLHIISKCELPFNSTIDSNDMIVRRANLSWQQ